MQPTSSLLATFLTVTSCATGNPLQARQDTLKDWQVTSAGSHTPSGRPGSYPWATITANITDPNQLTLGTASDGKSVTVPAGSQGIVRLLSRLPQCSSTRLLTGLRTAKPSTTPKARTKARLRVPGHATLSLTATGPCKSRLVLVANMRLETSVSSSRMSRMCCTKDLSTLLPTRRLDISRSETI
jgi:hypothetical protein